MGWGKEKPRETAGSDPLGMERIDLERYDFDGFRADVEEIIDLPQAMQQATKWALGVPLAITVVVWLVFSGRMPGYVLVTYAVVVFILSLFGAAVLGVFLVARQRVDQTTAAAGRVVELVGLLHDDFDRVKSDGVPIPVRDVGALLAAEVVFPAVFGAAGQSTTLAGPMGFLLRPALKIPMDMVERKVIAALEQLPSGSGVEPEDASGDLTDDQLNDLADKDPTGDGPVADGSLDGVEVVGQLASATGETVSGVAAEYENVQQRLEQIVGTVGVVALGPVAAFAVFSFVPLVLILLLGWWLT